MTTNTDDKAVSFSNPSNARRAGKAAGIPEHEIEIIKVGSRFGYARSNGEARHVALATEKDDLGTMPAGDYKDFAQGYANENNVIVTARNPVTDAIIRKFKPTKGAKKAKGEKKAKAKGSAPRARREKKAEGPTGKTAQVIKLALREKGVTAAELIEATGWSGAPWKWNFENPKGTGWAKRFGYKFKSERVDGTVRYFLKAA